MLASAALAEPARAELAPPKAALADPPFDERFEAFRPFEKFPNWFVRDAVKLAWSCSREGVEFEGAG